MSVKSFYEKNTRRFIRFGGGRDEKVIHREVWGEGVKTKRDAFHFSHALIRDHLPKAQDRVRVLDLGCGVGSSLKYLISCEGERVECVGVSISPLQVAEARRLVPDCKFLEADFTSLPELKPFQLAYAIEAFVHAPSPEQFFASVSRVLVEGGLLILIDDFLEAESDSSQLRRFREGWKLGSLLALPKVEYFAENAGLQLTENLDLTPYLNLGRPRDWFIKAMVHIPGVIKLSPAYLGSLDGGDALQTCLKQGLIKYRMLCFTKGLSVI